MECQEDIDLGMSIWVTKSSLLTYRPKVLKIDGIPIDGDRGFGNQEVKEYSGEAILLSPKYRKIQNLTLFRVHTSRNGWGWGV